MGGKYHLESPLDGDLESQVFKKSKKVGHDKLSQQLYKKQKMLIGQKSKSKIAFFYK